MRVDVAVTYGRQEVVQLFILEVRRDVFQLHVREPEALELLLHQITSARDVLLTLLASEPLENLLARISGVDVAEIWIQPVAAWAPWSARRDDLHDVAVLQAVIQRYHAPIDLGTYTHVAHFG